MPAFTIELPNGKRLGVEADDENAAMTGAQQWYKQNVTDQTSDTSTLGALSQGVSDVASGVGKTIKHYISPDAGNAVLDSKLAKSNPNYQSASEGFMRPADGADNHVMGLDWSKLPRALIEQAPGLAADLALQKIVPKAAGPVGKYIANAVSFGGRTAGNEAEHRAAERTGDPNAEPTLEDKITGLKSTGAQMVLNQIGLNKILSPAKVAGTGVTGALQAGGNVLKAAGAEGLTNAGQDLISQAAAKQGTDKPLDLQETLGQGVMGAAGGGIFSGPRGAKDAAVALRHGPADEHTAMAANRILDKVESPKDLQDPKKAFEATSGAIRDVNTELTDAARNVTNPSTEAANAIVKAKAGETLTPKELTAIDSVGDERLSSLARQSHELAQLTEKGNYNTGEGRFAGGASEFARKNARSALFTLAGAGAIPHVVGQGGVGLDTLVSSLPGAAEGLAAGLVGYKGLKVLDRVTGLSSPARTFAEKFGNGSGTVRPDAPTSAMTQAGVSVPSVTPQNSLTTPQPWGPVPDAPQRFKPDVLDPGIAKIVEKIQRQKQQQTAREAMPLLRQLAEQNKPAPEAPGPDANAMNEQVKSALLMAAARRKIEGQRQAEAEAEASPMVQEQGGLEAVSNPAMGKRAQEIIAATNALARLRRQPEEQASPPLAPEQPEAPTPPPAPAGPSTLAEVLQRLHAASQPQDAPQPPPREPTPEPPPFVLPESPHVFKEPKEAAAAIYADAVAGGKEIRNPEGYKAGTTRRLAGEEAIYNTISKELNSVQERGDFHKYLAALWGSDSPEVVTQVRDHMVAEFPHHAETINKHLSDTAIKGLWTKPKKKK